MQATLTINGQTVSLEGTAAELAEAIAKQTTLVVPKEAKAKAPKEQPKAAPKPVIVRKDEGIGEGKALTKGTRAAFGKAFLKAFGEPDPELAKEIGAKGTVIHWSTKQLATLAVSSNQVPKGYRVGAGYRQLVGPEAEEAIAKAKANLAPKGRVRNAKGQFVKQS